MGNYCKYLSEEKNESLIGKSLNCQFKKKDFKSAKVMSRASAITPRNALLATRDNVNYLFPFDTSSELSQNTQ